MGVAAVAAAAVVAAAVVAAVVVGAVVAAAGFAAVAVAAVVEAGVVALPAAVGSVAARVVVVVVEAEAEAVAVAVATGRRAGSARLGFPSAAPGSRIGAAEFGTASWTARGAHAQLAVGVWCFLPSLPPEDARSRPHSTW